MSDRAVAAVDWSAVASLYTRMEAFTTHYARDAAAAMLQVLSATPSSGREIRIADIACGTGVAAFALVDKLRTTPLPAPVTVLASDISPGMLEKVSERWSALAEGERPAGVRVEAVPACDMTNMSAIPTGSLDGIVCVFGLMFAADPVAALREFKRVLKPGAPAVIATWTTDASSAAIALECRRRLIESKIGSELVGAIDFSEPGGGLSLPSVDAIQSVVAAGFGADLPASNMSFDIKCYTEVVAMSDFTAFFRLNPVMAKCSPVVPPWTFGDGAPGSADDALAVLIRDIVSTTPFLRDALERGRAAAGSDAAGADLVPLAGNAIVARICTPSTPV